MHHYFKNLYEKNTMTHHSLSNSLFIYLLIQKTKADLGNLNKLIEITVKIIATVEIDRFRVKQKGFLGFIRIFFKILISYLLLY